MSGSLPPQPAPSQNPYAETPVGFPQSARTSVAAVVSLVFGILSLLFSCLTGIVGLICGIVALVNIGNSEGRLKGSGLAISGIVLSCVLSLFSGLILVGMMLPAVQQVREASRRVQGMNNLRIIQLGQLNHESATREFPTDRGGLSWRVHLLPFLEQAALYERFHLDEPWDSEHNIQLLSEMPEFFHALSSSTETLEPGMTVYLRPVGNGAFPEPGSEPPVEFRDFAGGASSTICIVEADADRAVPWTKPADYQFDPANPHAGLGGLRIGGFNAAMGDGAINFISDSTDDQTLSALFTLDAEDNEMP